MPHETLSDADAQRSVEGFDQDPVREHPFHLVGQGRDNLAERLVLQRIVVLEPGCCPSKLGQQAGIQIRIPEYANLTYCGINGPEREAGRPKRERTGRGKGRFPGGSLLDLQEHRRARIPCENQPVPVTSPYGFALTPVEAHRRDGGPGFDPGDFYLGALPAQLAGPLRFVPHAGTGALALALVFAAGDWNRVARIIKRDALICNLRSQSCIPVAILLAFSIRFCSSLRVIADGQPDASRRVDTYPAQANAARKRPGVTPTHGEGRGLAFATWKS